MQKTKKQHCEGRVFHHYTKNKIIKDRCFWAYSNYRQRYRATFFELHTGGGVVAGDAFLW